jgi:hypothetical protein
MSIDELQDGLKAQRKDFDRQIEKIKDAKEKATRKAQEVIREQWNKQSEIVGDARVIIGPKMYQLRLSFGQYSPHQLTAQVVELSLDGHMKDSYSAQTCLSTFLNKYKDVQFVGPNDPHYSKMKAMDPSKAKSYQGFRIGQKVTFQVRGHWKRTTTEGTIKNFTKTGKVTVASGYEGRFKTTLDISKIKPVEND